MSTITTSQTLARFLQNKTFEVEVGAVRPATLTKAEEFVAMLGENLPDTEVEAPDPQDFRRLIQSPSKRWGPLRLKQLRAFVLGWLRWCLEDEGLIERMSRTGSLKTPKVVAKPEETYTYTTAASKVWADVRNTSQRKTEDGFVQNSGAETYEVWIRYRPDVIHNTRILFDGLTLSVVNIEHQWQLRHALRLRCEAVNR